MCVNINFIPNKEVLTTIEELLKQCKEILGVKLVGFYLYGSLATGDFDTGSSDIDFVAVISEKPSAKEIERLKDMHAMLRKNYDWGKKLEGAYIPVSKMKKYDPNYEVAFLSADSPFRITKLGADWIINLHILITSPVVLYGPDPKTLVDPVPETDLKNAVKLILKSEWVELIDADVMKSRHYQGFAVLTMCRAIYALEKGEIVSKTKAAAWSKEALDPKWGELIEKSLLWRKQHQIDEETLIQTKEFVKEILSRYAS